MRDQLWRYYPQMGAFSEDFASDWFLDLWHAVPTPDQAARATNKAIGRILKNHRIRRFDAATVLGILRQPPLTVAPGTIEAATAHIRTVAARLRLVNTQIKETERRLDELCAAIELAAETAPGQICEQRDLTIATWRSCVPVQGSEGSTSPRCSPRPASLSADEIIMSCGPCRGWLPSPSAAARVAS